MDQDDRPRVGQALHGQHVGQGHLEQVETVHEGEVQRSAQEGRYVVIPEERLGGGGHHRPVRMVQLADPGVRVHADDPCLPAGQPEGVALVDAHLQVAPGLESPVHVGQEVEVRRVRVHASRRHHTPVQSTSWIGSRIPWASR